MTARSTTLIVSGVLGVIPLLLLPGRPAYGLGDNCTAATVIADLPFNEGADTASATVEGSDPMPACGNGSRLRSVWYRFTSATGDTVAASTLGSSYDTILSVYTGDCVALTPVPGACSDDAGPGGTSQVSFATTVGHTYYFMITAFGNGGALAFALATVPTPTPTASPTPSATGTSTDTPSPTPTVTSTPTLPARRIERISVDKNGVQGNAASYSPAMSADGRYVAFESLATNLLPGPSGGPGTIIYVRDRGIGTIERIRADNTDAQSNYSPAISADGRFVAFCSYTTSLIPVAVLVRDRQTGTTEQVSVNSDGTPANASGGTPAISADGRYVAFTTLASNLVDDDTNDAWDVFVHDRQTGKTERVSISSEGKQANCCAFELQRPAISADGRYVAFASLAANLVPDGGFGGVFVRDRQAGTTERASVDGSNVPKSTGEFPAISADGRYVAFGSRGSGGHFSDVFVRDRQTATTEQVSVNTNGMVVGDLNDFPAISADGRYVAFETGSAIEFNTIIVVRDQVTATTEAIGAGGTPAIGADDSFVGFASGANYLVPADTNQEPDVFVSSDCREAICGDGDRALGCEQCDDGDATSNDSCKNDCTRNVCGDGVIQNGVEECDGLDVGTCPSGCTELCVCATRPPNRCPGDCDDLGSVTVDELVQGVNIALGNSALDTCLAADADSNHRITVDELVRAVGAARNGC